MLPTELDAMLTHDEHHWWYRGRRRILRAVLDGLDLPEVPRLLDAGCGSGRTLDVLARYGTVSGVDLSATSVACARRRGHADVRQEAVETLPFPDASFDVVTCLDVVEHTPDDVATVRELARVTRPGGAIVLTVPAHPRLWSAHDEVNLHYRRYTARSLAAVGPAAGLQSVRQTYFNSTLLAPAAVVRLTQRLAPHRGHRSDLERTPAAADRLLEQPLAVEARLIAHGVRIPAGLSLLCVLRRPGAPATRIERALRPEPVLLAA